jgi:gliding motility-associated-like protein
MCQGDSLLIAGQYRLIAGIYDDTLATSLGCDSIVRTTLIVNPTKLTNLNASICAGDSLFIGGQYRLIAGIYDDSLATSLGCDSIVRTILSVNPLTTASFTYVETSMLNYTFTNTSSNALSYEWNFGDTQTSAVQDPTHVYNTGGDYTVSLITTNTCGKDTATQVISVFAEFEFFNGFSPNGDGQNDYWNIPMLNFYTQNKVSIISRWGDKVWETENYNNLDNSFVGKNMNGKELPDGTYFYIIEYNNTEKRGWVFIKR